MILLRCGRQVSCVSALPCWRLRLIENVKSLSDGTSAGFRDRRNSGPEIDAMAIRDGQRIIESIETIARIHNAQEEDIYEHAAAG
jgi:hypothetical protein